VLGGCTSQCAHGESAVDAVHRYDPRLNTWLKVKSMLTKRAYFYACALNVRSGNGLEAPDKTQQFIYAIGGKNREGALSSVERYDLSTNSWSFVRSMPAAYYAHAGCVMKDTVYVSGGYMNGQFTADLHCYLPDTDQWLQLKQMNAARGWHCMCVANERLYVFGGCYLNSTVGNLGGNAAAFNSPHPLPQHIAQAVTATEFYSVKSNQWHLARPMPNLHKEASCFSLNNFVYVLGGYNIQAKTGQRFISRYDYVKDVWETSGHCELPAGMTGMGLVIIDIPWFMFKDSRKPFDNLITTRPYQSKGRHFNYSYLYNQEETLLDSSFTDGTDSDLEESEFAFSDIEIKQEKTCSVADFL